jgi:hypothetical protein
VLFSVRMVWNEKGALRPYLEISAVVSIPLFAMWVLVRIIHDRVTFARLVGLLTVTGLLVENRVPRESAVNCAWLADEERAQKEIFLYS